MAKDAEAIKSVSVSSLGGQDESVEITDKEGLVAAGGVFPFFYGMHQRHFGKKTIDYNPGQQVLGIHQSFNGICLYGYYVETDQKLYYHVCVAPPDLRIHWIAPLQLG